MIRRGAGWIGLALIAGCDRPAHEQVADPAMTSAAPAAADIHLPRYRPPGEGGPEAFMEAGMGGTLALNGSCLGFAGGADAAFSTLVWPAGARLGRDARGLFVEVDGGRFRIGEFLTGGGGSMPADFTDARLERPFPVSCDRSRAVEFHSIAHRPGGFPVPEPAPPPPPPLG